MLLVISTFFLKVTGSYAHCRCANVSERIQYNVIVTMEH